MLLQTPGMPFPRAYVRPLCPPQLRCLASKSSPELSRERLEIPRRSDPVRDAPDPVDTQKAPNVFTPSFPAPFSARFSIIADVQLPFLVFTAHGRSVCPCRLINSQDGLLFFLNVSDRP